MKKVLWICNVPTEDACNYKKNTKNVYGGWLSGLSSGLIENCSEYELVFCYPDVGKKVLDDFVTNGIHYYSFFAPKKFGVLNIDANRDNKLEREHIRSIINKEKPDIIHIFGTEFIHSLIAVQEAQKRNVVCSIQGMTSVYAQHYLAFIPNKIIHKFNFSSFFRGTLYRQKESLCKSGKIEVDVLKECGNVIGRTDWDFACTYFINPKRNYYLCNESLRSTFYNYEWSYTKCIPHSIFISQASSPIKGFINVVRAIELIKNEYPDITVNVAGNDFMNSSSFKSKAKISVYAQYVKRMIKRLGLKKNIVFLGELDKEMMCKAYLSANVFISASSIENSSNSIGEAMLLGMPVISSYVGGIGSLMNDGVEGLFYQADAPYMLAMRIKQVFDNPVFATTLGTNARKRALITHNKKINAKRLAEIYAEIIEQQGYN